ncbi:MAG: hypothetical protein ACRDXD_05295 [Acidimicrobiia bacterium]
MSLVPFVAAGGLVVAAAAWLLALTFLTGGPLAPDSGALLGTDLLLLSAVAATGVLLAHARWARRLAYGTLAAEGALAVVMPIGPWWWAALASTAAALMAVSGPWLEGWVRKLPSAAGPPVQAVLLALGLAALPGLVALSSPAGLTAWHWLFTALGLATLWAYSRARRAGLWVARLLPLAALPPALASPWGGAALLIGGTGVLARLAWTEPALLAVAPLVPAPHPLAPSRWEGEDAS